MSNQQVLRSLQRKFDTRRKWKGKWIKESFDKCKGFVLEVLKWVNDLISNGSAHLPVFEIHPKRRMCHIFVQENKVFYESVRKSLFLLRLSGLLPIEGLLNPDSSHARLTFKSVYTIFYGFALSLQVFSLLMVYKSLSASTLIVSTLMTISLFYLSRKWIASLTKIESIEVKLPALRNRKKILQRIHWFVVGMMIIALCEHMSYVFYTIFMVKYCFLLDDDSGWYLRSYFLAYHKSFFNYIPFSYTLGFLIQILKIQFPIICTLADVFIVAVTVYLSHRFKNFYRILVETIKNRAIRRIPWTELRAHYTRLTILVVTVDDLINPLTFTVFLSHLMQMCKQIYDVLQKKRIAHMFQSTACVVVTHGNDAVTIIYLCMSLSVLLLRSLVVSLMGAHLHTLSRAPLNVLHTAPSSVYDGEMQKLMDQIYNSKICLSGLGFFYVTRGTVLSMLSTILTYELMLLQIND